MPVLQARMRDLTNSDIAHLHFSALGCNYTSALFLGFNTASLLAFGFCGYFVAFMSLLCSLL
jgi:hypothetical protein